MPPPSSHLSSVTGTVLLLQGKGAVGAPHAHYTSPRPAAPWLSYGGTSSRGPSTTEESGCGVKGAKPSEDLPRSGQPWLGSERVTVLRWGGAREQTCSVGKRTTARAIVMLQGHGQAWRELELVQPCSSSRGSGQEPSGGSMGQQGLCHRLVRVQCWRGAPALCPQHGGSGGQVTRLPWPGGLASTGQVLQRAQPARSMTSTGHF